VRTIVNIPDDDKTWLMKEARRQKVTMTELVRRAIKNYRQKNRQDDPDAFSEALKKTKGRWKSGDGLKYQKSLRDEWR
jgi:hypothetical protein